jgi:hypothetical protein
MGVLRNRISYRRANAENAEYMAGVRELFCVLGDTLEAELSRDSYEGTPEDFPEFQRSMEKMLDDLESASRHAIKAILLATGSPIDSNPGELHYRAPETDDPFQDV